MGTVRLSALIVATILLGAPLATNLAVAQIVAPTRDSESGFQQVLDDARATFSVSPIHGDIELGFGSERNGKRVSPFDLAGLESFQDIAFHRGADYAAAEGAPIVAPGPGRVSRVELDDSDNGTWLEIDHGEGLLTRYTHLSGVDVRVGQDVVAEQPIARVGHTGAVRDPEHPHLHFEVLSTRLDSGSERFIDPELVLPAQNGR